MALIFKRAWYVGLQAITIPAAFEPPPPSSASTEQDSKSVGEEVVHWNTDDTIKPIDDISSVLSDPVQNDDSFDSMTLTLTMATAPIVDENQL